MNLYSLNTIKQNYSIPAALLSYNAGLHTEDLTINFYEEGNDSLIENYSFIENGVLLQSWMTLLDLNDADTIGTPDLIAELEQAMSLLHIRTDNDTKKSFELFLNELDALNYAETATAVLDLLKEIFEKKPILGYLYPAFYKIMSTMYSYVDKQIDLGTATSSIKEYTATLTAELDKIQMNYASAQEYVKNVFVLPFEESMKLPSSRIALFYQSFCLTNRKDNFYSTVLAATAAKNDGMDKIDHKSLAWSDYLTNVSNAMNTNDSSNQTVEVASIEQFLNWGIDQMIDQELTLRKCQNCGGYFCVKYTSIQEYCNRSFSNASTCSEYASRKSYKDRLFENPINTEYTKSYNKLYARIRRKKLSADTPLKDELLRLRNEYMERYEHTSKKDREAVWKEYIQKNKELLG